MITRQDGKDVMEHLKCCTAGSPTAWANQAQEEYGSARPNLTAVSSDLEKKRVWREVAHPAGVLDSGTGNRPVRPRKYRSLTPTAPVWAQGEERLSGRVLASRPRLRHNAG